MVEQCLPVGICWGSKMGDNVKKYLVQMYTPHALLRDNIQVSALSLFYRLSPLNRVIVDSTGFPEGGITTRA
jgi:hypothetical protein